MTDREPLIDAASCERVIATMDQDLAPCSRDEATSLVAILLSAYPGIRPADGERQRDFRLYCERLFEAFSQFSAAIGRAIVHGGTGVPSLQPYKPQPADIVKFGKAEVRRIQDTKTMAQRHIAERARREREAREHAAFEASLPDRQQRAAQVERLLGASVKHP